MIDDINKNLMQQLNKRLELIIEHNKSLKCNLNSRNDLVNKTLTDLTQRYKIRNNYYRKKFPSLLHDLSILKSNEKHFQSVEKRYYQSIKFYKNISNIQSSINIKQYDEQLQQSTIILDDLKTNISQYENSIEQSKQEFIQQNEQIKDSTNKLSQIQYEQHRIQSDIKQLKQNILFEKNLYSQEKEFYSNLKTASHLASKKLCLEEKHEYVDQCYQQQQILSKEEITLKNLLKNIKDSNQNKLNQCHTEHNHLSKEISRTKFDIRQKRTDLLQLQHQLSDYKTKSKMNQIVMNQSKTRTLFAPPPPSTTTTTTTTITSNKEEIIHKSAPLINKLKTALLYAEQHQQQHPLSVESTNKSEQKSLGPNLQSRLEALEVAMGVRLNVAKRQGRHSLSNTASSSPMQLSPTSSSTTTINTSLSNSLSISTRHNIPLRTGQGVQRSASSCDAENRPGPIKRLKPSCPNENSSVPSTSSTVAAIATIKKYPPSVRRPLPIPNMTPTLPNQSKQSTPIKQRSSPMDTSSPRLSRSSTASSNSSSNSSNYRTPIGSNSPKIPASPLPKQILNSSTPNKSAALVRKRALSIFGEQFSDDIIKINLLWIDLKELDNDSRSEVILQFGSIENFLREQNLFFTTQKKLKLASKNKTIINRSRFHLSIMKKDRLELL
ncbi:unnamed protein product [Rotaria magnacalcarata]|uniref:Uncharacterized protein n=1 Tax=Rotaria magnacalcarata TaxID=392030 RepID=A0A816MQR5_9BILA|nr:unnamed protein product [Rotaria magnacalcarata]CAF1630574.1 unnamed protein product [Rotaria magnacalcarata]CAF2013924.1 unnamed protein product [Rotaria magnacalcarata]